MVGRVRHLPPAAQRVDFPRWAVFLCAGDDRERAGKKKVADVGKI